MNSATVPYKVSVRLGQAEFSAEGPEETVRDQLASFLQIASAQPLNSSAQEQERVCHSNGNGHANGHTNGHANGNGKQSETPNATLLPDNWQQWIETVNAGRLFAEDKVGVISVRMLPNSDSRDADTLFLVLFGYLVLKNQNEVKANLLLRAAKQSGIVNLLRIDTVLDRFPALVRRGGVKRGSWYSLTNPGIAHAEKLARESFA